jgi:FemAB-related protein (PEP-CTERM system-associated)
MTQIVPLTKLDFDLWDTYISNHLDGSVYHLSFFKTVIEKTYHHRSYYFVAKDSNLKIVGVLPLFYIRSFLFGNALVSIPFCDYEGILADTPEISKLLFEKALQLSKALRCPDIELRQTTEQLHLEEKDSTYFDKMTVQRSKVRMVLSLPETSEDLFAAFTPKLRSQIRKPQKEGCVAKSGGTELLDDFYDVFVHNMRDLGSPVHTKQLMKRMIEKNPENIRIFVIYHNNVPVACSLVAGFNKALINPWASFKRTYQKIAPNMLLYWEMLTYAISKRYHSFDFGRSTPGEGTFNFKEQWGAIPQQLYWYHLGQSSNDDSNNDTKKEKFINVWRKLPLPVTKAIGPIIRRHIHL